MSLRFDTIFASITGLPPAAISVVRLSGPEAWETAGKLFEPWPETPAPRYATYGKYFHGDDGIAIAFAEGHSFTGEQTVEMSIHGSRASLSELLAACEQAGARPAKPGEFTLRAFLNGRIDLTQAEAVRETVEAETERQLRSANRNREGRLRDEVSNLRKEVTAVLAALEASVDFSEEIGEFDREKAFDRLHPVAERIQQLGDQAQSGRILREGLRIAIVGPTNAGKSSLLNALLGVDRAIVSEVPGTTRDYVEERASFLGYPVVLVDTAGLRETIDPIESIGVQRARSAAANADLIWFVFDASLGLTQAEHSEIARFERPVKLLANKSDLWMTDVGQPISAKTRLGLDSLIAETANEFQISDDVTVVNARQAVLLAEAHSTLVDALEHLEGDTPSDLLSVLLCEILDRLGQITGETIGTDMLERIFRDFCIGK
jgi:tRNA modification GTPase